MKLIIIRHGEPDYENDSLTEKGKREAALLAERAVSWNVKDIYVSSLGRARETASYTLKKLGREATKVCDWMQEFYYPVTDPVTGRYGVPWDFTPEYLTSEPLFYDKDRWFEAEVYKQAPEIPGAYKNVCEEFDRLLSGYGYKRVESDPRPDLHIEGKAHTGGYYDVSAVADPDNDEVIVFFCHLGLECVILSHLLGISPVLLWHGICLAPTSVTILNPEMQIKDKAWFRAQVIGDTSHLYVAGEPVSRAGAFSTVFSG